MSSAWIVSGLLYMLGVVMAYVGLEAVDDLAPRWVALAWPVIVAVQIAIGLYMRFIGDPLCRRRHAKWCKETSPVASDGRSRTP